MRIIIFVYLFFLCSVIIKAEQLDLIKIATSTDFPPFVTVEDGQLTGFDVDLLKEVASKLKKTIKFLPVESSYVLSTVTSGLADLGAGGFSISEERKKFVDFTTPYFDAGFVIVIRKNQEDLDINKLYNKKIGTYVSDFLDHYIKTLKLDKNMVYGRYHFLFDELIAGAIDAILVDYPFAKYMVSNNYKDTLKITGPLYFQHQYGFIVTKNHPLKKDIDRAIETILTSSTYQRIYSKWFGD